MRRLAIVVLALGLHAAAAPCRAREEKTAHASKDAAERVPLARQRPPAQRLALVGGTLHRVTSADMAGTLLLEGGRIAAILPPGRAVPRGFRVVDVAGRHVYPGFVASAADGLGLAPDAYAGGADAGLSHGIAESFDAWSDGVHLAASAGITSAMVLRVPLEPHGPLAGRGALMKMSWREPRGTELRDPAAVVAAPAAWTPAGRDQLRKILAEARKGEAPEDAMGVKALLRALGRGRIPLMASPQSPGDVLAVVDLASDEKLPLIVSLSNDAWSVSDELARAHASAIQHVRNTWSTPRGDRRTEVTGGWRADAATVLTRAGVPCSISTASDTIDLWGVAGRDLLDLPLEAAFAERGGLSADEALAAITIVPARLFGVEERIGSLEPGKDADVVVMDGDALDYRSLVRETYVNGVLVYRADGDRYWKGIAQRRDAALSRGGRDARPDAPERAP